MSYPATVETLESDFTNASPAVDLHELAHDNLGRIATAIQTQLVPGGTHDVPRHSQGIYADAPSGGDDTSRLQSALTAAMAAGQHCFLQPGFYKTTSMLSVDGAGYSGGGFGIVGSADGATSINGPSGGSDLEALLKIGITNFAQRITLRDFSINYPAGHTHTTGQNILAATHGSVMDRVIANNAPQDSFAILNPFTSTQFLRMSRCESWFQGRDGLHLAQMTDAWVDKCIFTGFGSISVPHGRYGIYNQGFGIEYTDNWCYQNGSDGFHADTGGNLHIRGGQYADNNGFGINIANVDKLVIDAVELFDNPSGPLQLGVCTDIDVSRVTTGRILFTYPLPTTAFYLTNCRYGSIHDNVIDGFLTNGMVLQFGDSNINIHDNTIKSFPGSGSNVAIYTDGTWLNVHDNIMFQQIFEGSPGNHNRFHDNQMNGAAITVSGVNSVSANNW